MESFGEIISSLLIRHNCVIVPNFGGFVSRTTSSQIDESKGIIAPPRKSIMFNQQLTTSDGLLVSEFALNNEISFSAAQEKIEKITNLWKEELDHGRSVVISKVGELSLNKNGNLIFTQDRFFNLLLSSYGLGQVKFVPIFQEQISDDDTSNEAIIDVQQQEKTLIQRTEEEVDLSIIEHPSKFGAGKKWKYALAAACLLPIAFYSFWIPSQTNVLESGIFSWKDFNPFSHATPAVYKTHDLKQGEKLFEDKSLEEQINELSPDTYVYSYEFDESLFLTIKIKDKPTVSEPIIPNLESSNNLQTIPNNAITPIVNETTNNQLASPEIQFEGVKGNLKYAIVGCFADVNNAKNYISELSAQGFNAKFLDFKSGLYRISIDQANSIDSLQNTIQRASSKGYNTWILK